MADDQIDSSEIRITGPVTPELVSSPMADGRKPASPLDGINATERWSATRNRPRFVTRWWTGSPVLSRTSPEQERGLGAR